MRNIISTVLFMSFLTLTSYSQTINWISTSEFEKEVLNQKNENNFFILIDSPKSNTDSDQYSRMYRKLFSFLQDEQIVEFINSNFLCYKFNINESESLTFNKKEYEKNESKNGIISHEFVDYLTGDEKSMLPAIVLRNNEFELFEFQKANIQELNIMLEGEKIRLNYLSENLGLENAEVKKAERMVMQSEKRIKKAIDNPNSYSVFPLRGLDSRRLQKKLEYFLKDHYKKSDLKTYLFNN